MSVPSRASVRSHYKNLARLLSDQGIRMTATHLGRRAIGQDGNDWEHDEYRCTFRKAGEQGSVTFSYSMGIGHERRKPIAEEVMEGLLFDSESVAEESFSEWCANLGLDTDSRRAEQMYLACRETARRLTRYFGATLFRNMQVALRKDYD